MQLSKLQHKSLIWQRGFTLIEILISVIIIAIGLLGMAALQVSTLKNSNSSSMRTQATFLAEDIADRMRRADAAALDPNGDGNYADSLYVGRDTSSYVPGDDPGCIAGGCTPTQLVTYDMVQWKYGSDGLDDMVDGVASLPSGRAQIIWMANVAPNPPYENTFRIRIMWDDERTGATGIACSSNYTADLVCFDLEVRP